jgi:very-short-patch-repair endonuclease
VTPHCLSDKRKTSKDFIRWHYGQLDPNAAMIGGTLVVGEVQMICDLATSLTPESLLASINHCLHENLFTKEQLLSVMETRPGMKGGNLLKRLLRFATPKCESPLETIAWTAIYKAGLTLPQQQVLIRDNNHAFIGCVDMYWEVRKRKIVLELDGQSKYKNDPEGKVQFTEKVREDKLREQGYEMIRSYWSEVRNGKMIQKLIDNHIPPRRNFTGTFPKQTSAGKK